MFSTLAPGAIGVKGLDIAASVALARNAGFAGVVFDIRQAAAIADEHGLDDLHNLFAESNVRPGYWGLPVSIRDEQKWRADLRTLPHLAKVGRDHGCPRVTAGVTPGSDDLPYDDNFAWHVERLRPVAEILASEGCRLGIEFIGPKTFRSPFRHEFIYTLGGVMELAAAIGTGNVGVLLDAWHLYTSGGTLAGLDALSAEDIVAVHVNDAPADVPVDEQIDNVRALPLETGVIDLVGFMTKLRDLGYDGPVMPEPFSKRIDDLGAVAPLAAARETAASMGALWRAAKL